MIKGQRCHVITEQCEVVFVGVVRHWLVGNFGVDYLLRLKKLPSDLKNILRDNGMIRIAL